MNELTVHPNIYATGPSKGLISISGARLAS